MSSWHVERVEVAMVRDVHNKTRFDQAYVAMRRHADVAVGLLLDAKDRGVPYGGEAMRAMAQTYAAAFEVLVGIDPRAEMLRGTSLTSPMVNSLLERALHVDGVAADEIEFGAVWTQYQLPTFTLSASLMAQLLLTDPGKVSEQDVAWPFPAFRVQLPSPDCAVPFGTDSPDARMSAIHVLSWRIPQAWFPDELVESARGLAKEDPVEACQRMISRLLEHYRADSEPAVMVRCYDNLNTASLFVNLPWHGDERPLRGWTDTDSVDQYDVSINPLRANAPLDDRDRLASRIARRLVVNLALYLASDDEETSKPIWRATMKSTGRVGRNWNVGSGIKIGREIREAASAVAVGRRASAPQVRFLRRGHFCNQAYGPGWSEHRRIYRKPVWVGPAEGPVKDRNYEVR